MAHRPWAVLAPDHKLARNWPTVSRGGGILWRPPIAAQLVNNLCITTQEKKFKKYGVFQPSK